ncbi:MAG: hypothetical protein J1G07_03260 [Clostridiales bacterium]|nr:hypothetical protein [Clostridiales bacterium]
MGISKKEIEKKMLINKTISIMNKQIQKLEEQKKKYVEAGKEAKQKGLDAQYNLALTGLRMTIAQQRRVYEMKLNFEITSQMKDMTQMTSEFLTGMSSLSKDMMKLTKEKDFLKVQKQFTEAMMGVEMQTEQLENFMDETQSTFATSYMGSAEENKELENLMNNEAASDNLTESMIDKELEELKKRMSN